MQLGIKSKEGAKDHLKEIEDYVTAAAKLTRQLLGFARKGQVEVKPIDINRLVKKGALMFGRTRKEIEIKSQYQEDLWSVEVDPGQMDQVFLNLFVNAGQAMSEGGELYLDTKNVILDESTVRPHQVRPGKFVKISVTDTGVGMDEETRQRIFDPFFTTKERGRGTGLGLATVYGIMKNHGGFITVFSEKGIGTTFNLYLPASDKQPVVETVASQELVYGSETILLVDDEDIVIDVVGQILENLGYKVLLARSGMEAIEIYWANRSFIDLVILDIIMPHMSGAATYDRLKGIDPDVKVLLCSGYSVDSQAAALLQQGCMGFLQKPFNTRELSRKIRDILDNTGEAAPGDQSG
jgi:CheY-like chemotaxis protein